MSQDKMPKGSNSPGTGAFEIIPSDSEFADYTRGIYVGVGGNIVVVMEDDSEVRLIGVPTGTILPIRCKKVLASSGASPTENTTAESLVGLF